jgi:hypothetical protein
MDDPDLAAGNAVDQGLLDSMVKSAFQAKDMRKRRGRFIAPLSETAGRRARSFGPFSRSNVRDAVALLILRETSWVVPRSCCSGSQGES